MMTALCDDRGEKIPSNVPILEGIETGFSIIVLTGIGFEVYVNINRSLISKHLAVAYTYYAVGFLVKTRSANSAFLVFKLIDLY